ncbi:thioredoxin [Chitiniphilus eburneus]|uniref:thioredoxin n=1 Tax=Chitiniphilus eburneus TaxID=2571148 RepID=UPI00145CE78E|nr:thioredoxin [Chitiniphilus eburneus]
MQPSPEPIALLDPWTDARRIAERLNQADTRACLVLGAQAWCEKCRALYPGLVEAALAEQQRHPLHLWLWLDLEDHAEFIGDYLPEDLPELLCFERGQLIHRRVLEPGADLAGLPPTGAGSANDPAVAILQSLRQANWGA